jgi:hypothetical protein
MPAFFAENIPSDTAFDTDAERWTNRLTKIIMRLCNSRAQLTKTDLPEDDDEQVPPNVIPEFLSIGSEFEKWAETYPDCFHYVTVGVDQPTETVFSNYYHVYSNMFTSVVWNYYRSAHMLVNAMLKNRLLRMQNMHHAQLMRTDAGKILRETCHRQILKCRMVEHQLAMDVCASVAFCLSPHDWEASISQDKAKNSTFELVCGHRLAWPLYRVGAYLDTTDPMKYWITKTLIRVADLTGFKQAAQMSQALKDGIVW